MSEVVPEDFYGPTASKTLSVSVTTDINVRCSECNKYLAQQVTRPWTIKCHRCNHINELLS